jgi:hypothetical protein
MELFLLFNVAKFVMHWRYKAVAVAPLTWITPDLPWSSNHLMVGVLLSGALAR